MKIRRYSELIRLSTFEDRFLYLKLDGSIGVSTFGFDRYLNQSFYTSREWKTIRNGVIVRDQSCDLGILDRPIFGKVYIHHLNPISVKDVEDGTDILLDPEYLICTTMRTHNAIHFGDSQNLQQDFKERKKGDTTLW